MNDKAEKAVSRVIALEECFLHPKLEALYPPAYVKLLSMVRGKLTDVGAERIRRMDAAGIDLQVLSHVQPGVQTFDRETAIPLCTEVNDWLGGIVNEYPTRFAGFAMLPTQSPQHAADELERTVTRLGFKGALINGHTQGLYMDDISFSPLFERAQALDVPIYIHPADPPQPVMDVYYKNYPALMQSWGWQVEVGTHVLRMISGGVFDRYPRLKIIIGHMGELIPYALDRINQGLTMGNWLLAGQLKGTPEAAKVSVMQKSFLYYMRQNIFITTSGVFDQVPLNCAIAKLGIDNVLFSVDDPFGDNLQAMEFLNAAQLSPADKEKFAHGNAERVLNLSTQSSSRVTHNPSFMPRLESAVYTFKANAKSKLGRAMLSFLVK